MDINKLREEIDNIGKELLEILERRFEVSLKVGEYKIANKIPVYNAERENEIIEAIIATKETFTDEFKAVIKSIMTMSRQSQYKLICKDIKDWSTKKLIEEARIKTYPINKVAYCGNDVSYSKIACDKMHPYAESIGYNTFEDAVNAVVTGECDEVVLPIENSTAGSVVSVFELIFDNKLYINKALSYVIEHKLLTLQSAIFQDIKTVYSHPQALAQCKTFIISNSLKEIECGNTAFGANTVYEMQDKKLAAIGSVLAGDKYNLKISDIDINNEKCNRTRFVSLSRNLIITKQADKVSIAFKLPHTAGALSTVLYILSGLNINLTNIQSKPIPNRPWEYMFYAEFVYDNKESVMQALYQLEQELPEVYFLGWYLKD